MKTKNTILIMALVVFLTASYKTNSCAINKGEQTNCSTMVATKKYNAAKDANNSNLLRLKYSAAASF
jgi:hypothetical protein